MTNKRQFSAYEINHLLKHKLPISLLDTHPDTPVEYLSGHADFMERDFIVSPDVLIPRVETELLVEEVARFAKRNVPKEQSLTIADIGTGSGAIGLSLWFELQQEFSQLHIILSDISSKALKIAKQNKQKLIPPAKTTTITCLQSDLLLDYPDSRKIDIIVANLPYIPDDRISQLPKSVSHHEPHLALKGGHGKGLDLVNLLVQQAEKLVFRPQAIFLEVDEYVEARDLYQSELYSIEMLKDQFQKNRFGVYLLKQS